MSGDRIVAVGLLRQKDIDRLGLKFTTLWPVQDTPCFGSLLDAIDQADREYRQDADRSRCLGESHPQTPIIRADRS